MPELMCSRCNKDLVREDTDLGRAEWRSGELICTDCITKLKLLDAVECPFCHYFDVPTFDGRRHICRRCGKSVAENTRQSHNKMERPILHTETTSTSGGNSFQSNLLWVVVAACLFISVTSIAIALYSITRDTNVDSIKKKIGDDIADMQDSLERKITRNANRSVSSSKFDTFKRETKETISDQIGEIPMVVGGLKKSIDLTEENVSSLKSNQLKIAGNLKSISDTIEKILQNNGSDSIDEATLREMIKEEVVRALAGTIDPIKDEPMPPVVAKKPLPEYDREKIKANLDYELVRNRAKDYIKSPNFLYVDAVTICEEYISDYKDSKFAATLSDFKDNLIKKSEHYFKRKTEEAEVYAKRKQFMEAAEGYRYALDHFGVASVSGSGMIRLVELQKMALRDPSEKITDDSSEVLEKVQRLIKKLGVEDENDRITAINTLREFGAVAVPVMATSLKTEKKRTRLGIVVTLGYMRSADAVKVLTDICLEDDRPEIRKLAAHTLSELSNKDISLTEIVPGLVKHVNDEDLTVSQAANASLNKLTGRAIASPRTKQDQDQIFQGWTDWWTDNKHSFQ